MHVGSCLSVEEIISGFIDIVSKNGNLVLNIGPTPDGPVPVEQVERLQAFGQWLKTTGEAYFGSRPWILADGEATDGHPVRFTLGASGDVVYATVIGAITAGTVSISDLPGSPANVRLLGSETPLSWSTESDVLHIVLPDDFLKHPAYAFALSVLH